ncbi:MAG: M28 family peptidase [Gemmatimonadaceae bacterium]|jgi:hypothetical protein|nr:M28 family peptidase [Gemmatimonadaceae bacterium]
MRSPVVLAALTALLLPASSPLVAQTVWPDEGPRTWAPRPTEAAITANDLRTRLYQFADDSMMGREAGTLGNIKGTDYIAAEFKRLGLIPAGENGTYFQVLDYGRSAYVANRTTLRAGRARLVAGTDFAPLPPNAALGVSGAVTFDGVVPVFAGPVAQAALSAEQMKGRAVVFVGAPAGGQPPAAIAAARAAGAAVLLFVSDNLPSTAFTERVGMKVNVAGTMGGALITSGALSRLFGQAASGLAAGATGQPLSGAWTYTYTALEHPVRNVLAILPGADPARKGQYVLLGAHSDHVGMVRGAAPDHDSLRAFNTVMRPQGANDRVSIDAVTPQQWGEINGLIAKARAVRPPRLDTVNNGADDDGSGSMVLLEIAERFATGPRPARSILFHAHAAEEKGLLGSAWWTEHPTVPLDSVVAAHNMDMLGKGRVTDVKFGGPHSVQMLGSRRVSVEFGDMIDSLNAVRDEPMVIDYSWDRTNRLNRFCRSDQVSYIRKGIPTTYFSLGYSRDYHMPTDEPQYINYDLSARVARFVHDIASTIANRPQRLAVLPRDQQDPAARCGG